MWKYIFKGFGKIFLFPIVVSFFVVCLLLELLFLIGGGHWSISVNEPLDLFFDFWDTI